MKRCTRCKVNLPESAFQIKRSGELYLHCNKCRKVCLLDEPSKHAPLENHVAQLSQRLDQLFMALEELKALVQNERREYR